MKRFAKNTLLLSLTATVCLASVTGQASVSITKVTTPVSKHISSVALQKNTTAQNTASNQTTQSSDSSSDLWPILISKLNISDSIANHPAIRRQINWFLRDGHIADIVAMVKHASPYLYYVYHQVSVDHIPARFALLPMIESLYTPTAHSSVGAMGLWQLMRSVAHDHHIPVTYSYDGRMNVASATPAALSDLQHLYKRFHNWDLAAAAYNYGPGNIDRVMHDNERRGLATDYWSLPLPKETEEYVPRLYAVAYILKHAAQYHIHLPKVPNRPAFNVFDVKQDVSVDTLSHMADMSVTEFREFNPAVKSAQLPSQGTAIIVPVAETQSFEQAIKNHPNMNITLETSETATA